MRDIALGNFLGPLGLVYINGRMETDQLANRTFKIGNQLCPINYIFIYAWDFELIRAFEVMKDEESDHWPLTLRIVGGNKK